MIHIRIDDELNSKRRFACGIGPDLLVGDTYYFVGESVNDRADCPGCNPAGPRCLGTPISQLDGRIGRAGYQEYLRIVRSWGYE